MKLEEIEITFGSSVLVEKVPKTEFLHIVNSLCEDVFGSFLHVTINNKGWTTIIRYSKLKTNLSHDYCLLRILCLKDTPTLSTQKLSDKMLREVLYHNSRTKQPYSTYFKDFYMVDTTPIICHKELLAPIILKTSEYIENSLNNKNEDNLYRLLQISSHLSESLNFVFPDKTTDCESLYGSIYNNITNSLEQTRRIFLLSPEINQASFKILEKKVNNWKAQIKRKGRRELKKSLTLKPI